VARHGPPPLWAREPGFATLVLLVLEQQVSLASARAAFDRLVTATGTLSPAGLLALDDATLRAIGFSRQKAGYARGLAEAVLSGELDFGLLAALPDDQVRAALTGLRGIGPWTADVYLTMALLRPDAFPLGDLALLVSAQRVKRLDARPTQLELEQLAEAWRPHRATAARILWHAYLSERPTGAG
jgi:DNA-3-methyladenine glycosylase II